MEANKNDLLVLTIYISIFQSVEEMSSQVKKSDVF